MHDRTRVWLLRREDGRLMSDVYVTRERAEQENKDWGWYYEVVEYVRVDELERALEVAKRIANGDGGE